MTKKPSYEGLEKALRESEKRYRSVVDSIGIGISIISPKMEILSLNKQMRNWFPEIDVSKKPICYEAFNNPPRQEICTYCPTIKTLNDGIPYESVTSTPSSDSFINYRIISTPIKNEEGKVVSAIEMVEDVTEKMKAEEELRMSEDRYRTVVETQTELICRWKSDYRLTFVNDAYCRYFGMRRAELLGKKFIELLPEEEHEKVLKHFSSLSQEQPVLTHEHKVKHSSGRICWQQWTNRAIFDDRGQLVEIQDVGRDVTARKEAENKIAQLNDIFLNLNATTRQNINYIVMQTCELLQGAASLYNRLDDTAKSLCTWASANAPGDLKKVDTPDGHICYEATIKGGNEPVVLGELQGTEYEEADPNVKKYGLRSYLGYPVHLQGNTIGALCIVDVKPRKFSSTETQIISTLAKAVSLEEERKHAEEALVQAKDELEFRVEQRTAELATKNIALKEILDQIELEKKQITDRVRANVEKLLLPIIKKLKGKKMSLEKGYFDMLENNIKELTSSFGIKLTDTSLNLTVKEIEICTLIKEGFTGKEIATMHNLSYKTIDSHRCNIRKKLGITSKKVNLASYLRSL